MNTVVTFLALLACAALLYWLAVPQRWRHIYLLALSVAFMAALQPGYALYFLANVLLVNRAAVALRAGGARTPVFVALLAWLVGNLFFFKYIAASLAALHPGASGAVQAMLPVGISYVTFRQLHYVFEVYRGTVAPAPFLEYALYVLFFPTFLAGPVDRFPKFGPQIAAEKTFALAAINQGMLRIAGGIFKKFVLADTMALYLFPLLAAPQEHARVTVLLAVYGLALWLYFDFSGYVDMAIGSAKLFGYTVTENFNRPYLQKNIALFWRNWNISVYTFIRDYFYFPVFGYRATAFTLYAGIFLSMVVFNLWHNLTSSFLLLGLYHGTALTVWHGFQRVKARYAALRAAVDNPVSDAVSVFATFSFVSFGCILFNRDIAGALAIARRLAGLG